MGMLKLSRTATVCFRGLHVTSVDVQVQLASGLPAFHLVGLPDKAVAESKERVRAALYGMGLALPPKRITINLSPADLQKEGTHYDLPIALGLLTAIGALDAGFMDQFIAVGELALDGQILKTWGTLSTALHASSVHKGLICSQEGGAEAAWVGDLTIIAAPHLLDIINHIKGTQVLSRPQAIIKKHTSSQRDMKDILGQDTAKRVLEIAAAGGHNVLMVGPPGSGKSLLAESLPSILSPLTPEESLEVTAIHSLAGALTDNTLLTQRPFRAPHHATSVPALLGGGHRSKPGELSLAHKGVLFLDELPEFSRPLLESLRQPLESGEITIARANAHITYPAHTQLVAAMNPCPCGYLGTVHKQCRKAPVCGEKYQARLSGPLMDRIDLEVHVPALSPFEQEGQGEPESSSVIQKRVLAAQARQKERLKEISSFRRWMNGHVPVADLQPFLELTSSGLTLLRQASHTWHLSTRAYHRVLRVARTLADLAGQEDIHKVHIAEALRYCPHRNKQRDIPDPPATQQRA